MDIEKNFYCNTEYEEDTDEIDFNIEEYFAIDWDATGEKLKGLLMKHVTKKMLEELFERSGKTIDRYLENPHTLRMDEWIVIAKFLDMDITSIIVTKGQQRNINILENYFYEKEDVEQNPVSQKRTKGRPKKYDGPYKTSKDFRDKALYNEFTSRQLEDCKIRSVEEFLNYLPLVAPSRFADFMRCIWGNLYDVSGRQYMYKQMDRLIKSIPESDAKVFADQMTDYCLTKPVVTHTAICVVNDKIEQEKFEKYISYIKTEAADVEYEAYENACEQFSKGIAFLGNVKLEKF